MGEGLGSGYLQRVFFNWMPTTRGLEPVFDALAAAARDGVRTTRMVRFETE